MKYTILGFQQQTLIDNELTLEDALILRVVKDMYSSDRMESIIKNDNRYIWINQDYLLEQIPIIGSKSKLKRQLNKLSEEGYLENILVTNKKGIAGRFSYYKYTKKLNDLEDYDYMTKGQNELRPKVKMNLDQRSKWPNKDSTINDPSIKDSNNIYIDHFENCWKSYPNKKGKGKISDKTKKVIYNLGDEITRCIDRYVSDVEAQRKNGFNLAYQHGSTFFNSGYMDYLDAVYEEPKAPESKTSYNDPYAGMEIIS